MRIPLLESLSATPRSRLASAAWVLVTVLSFLSGSVAQADTPFEFKQDDVVAIFGNGLADRMQHDPWVEAMLQTQLKGMDVRFRNMSFSGDMVNKRPRSKGFTNDEEYLQHVAPSVVIAFEPISAPRGEGALGNAPSGLLTESDEKAQIVYRK